MKKLFLILALSASAWAQHDDLRNFDDAPVILHSGSGKGQDDRNIQFSGARGSDLVKNHQVKKANTVIDQAPPVLNNRNTGRVYRCKDGHREVYADDENKQKYSTCSAVGIKAIGSASEAEPVVERSAPNPVQRPQRPSREQKKPQQPAQPVSQPVEQTVPQTVGSPCSGAIVFQGGTYVFNEREPCPIPASVFQNRKPLEALPEYYQGNN